MLSRPQPGSCTLVIFGASGDLTKRKLIPALYDLFVAGHLTEHLAVLGVSRTEMADEVFRDHLYDWVKEAAQHFDETRWQQFAQLLHYHTADPTAPGSFPTLQTRLDELARTHGTGGNVLFYLALAPQHYEPVIVNLGANQMVGGENQEIRKSGNHEMGRARPWRRIIIEKPFGHDADSAADLNRVLGQVFAEESIYRIDHYLGKETVQNLLVFRFANTIFEPVWNRNYIDHVQVTAAETVGVEGRGGYYDSPSGGALRDMIQSHLLQVMALVAMEPPVSMSAADIRGEKTKVLRAVRIPTPEDAAAVAVRGQYGAGQAEGAAVPAFRHESGVRRDSRTDTYAALRLFVDTWRWADVPFYLRSGKRLARKTTEVVITFRPTPHCLFREQATCAQLQANQIVVNIQPDEGIRLRFEGKVPGLGGGENQETRKSGNQEIGNSPFGAKSAGTSGGGMNLKSVVMDFSYASQFQAKPPEAYATLLLDAIRGDQTLFKHREEIDRAWRIVQPVLDYWAATPQDDLPNYAAGAWGPPAADELLARDGRKWHNP